MRHAITLAAAILLASTTLAASSDIQLAKVNGDPVSSREIVDIFSNRHSGHARFLGGELEARTFLNIVIEDRLLIQEAYTIGLDQDPEVLKLVGDYESSKATQYLIATELNQKSNPTKDEIRATWEKSLNFFVKVRQISVPTKQEAEEVRAALVSGGDFDALVANCSQADSRFHNGRALVNWGQFDPEWERVVFAMQPGEISQPIPTPDGYDIIILDDHYESTPAEFDKVSGQIEVILRKRKAEELKKAWSAELWTKYHVVPAPIDLTPVALVRLLASAPDTVVATWDGGGSLKLKDTFNAGELRMWSTLSPIRAQHEIESRIRATVNDPLVALEAKERKVEQIPQVADDIQRYREYIMESVLYRDHIFHDLKVTDDDRKKYYEEHKSELVEPEQRHVAQILAASEAEAKKLREKLAAGADFEELAKTSSRDTISGRSGGDLGWITQDKVPPALKAVLTLGAGELTKPIQTNLGWHIIKVLEIKPQRQLTIEEAQETLQKKALDVKQRAARAVWVDKLRAAAKIEISDAGIKQFVKENEFKGEAPPQHVVK